jgi:AraC-like DNA-binding protein
MDVGFDSFSYFIVIFKQYNGCTPSDYRRRVCDCLTGSLILTLQ